MEVKILDSQDARRWNEILGQFSGRTLFHTAEWLGFLEATFHLEQLPLGLYRDGRIVGLFPALLDRKGPFKILGSPLTGWGTPYMGPLVDDDMLDEAMNAFDRFVKRLGVDYVEIKFPDARQNLPKMETYDRQAPETWILELDCGEDEAWRRLTPACRNRVRKAQNSGVSIVEAQERECVTELYAMFAAAHAKRNTTTSKSLRYYYDLWDSLKPAGLIKVLFAEYQGKRIASATFVMNTDTGYLFSAGSHSEHNKLAPNNLLHWHFISWAARNGLRRYDMVGKGIDTIDHFKRSFGCHPAICPQYSKASSGVAKVGRRVYGAVARSRLALQYRLNSRRTQTAKTDHV